MARRGRPIVIEWAADVRDFLRGTKGVERATEDIADELRDAGKDSDKFERKFSDAMKDAERQADRSARRMGDDFEDTSDRMGALGEAAGDEFVSNIGESIGSGDIDNIIQDVVGGLLPKMKGPLAAAAAGVAGIAIFAFQRVQEQAEEVTAFVESWSDGLMEMIRLTREELNLAAVEEAYKDWVSDNSELFTDMRPLIEDAGLDVEAFFRKIYEGDESAQTVLTTLRNIRDEDKTWEGQGNRRKPVYGKEGQAASDLLTNVQELINKQQDAWEEADAYTTIVGEDNTEAVKSVRDEWGELADDLRNTPPIVIDVEFNATGSGAAYATRGNTAYSPSNVATDNSHTRPQGRPRR